MLVLTRKTGERIQIGGGIELTVLKIRGHSVRLGFLAPPDVPIQREEIYRRMHLSLLNDAPASTEEYSK